MTHWDSDVITRDRAQAPPVPSPATAGAIADGSQHAGENDPEQHARQTLDEQVLDDGLGRVRAVAGRRLARRSR